jgi:hypothetical protein
MPGHAGQDQPVIRSERAATLLDSTAATATQANGTDMAGYDRAAFDIIVGTGVATAVLTAWLVESNESNLGNATNIQQAQNSSAQIAITAAGTANLNNTVRTLEVYRPAKRYVGVRMNAATANVTTISVVSRKWRGSGLTPTTVTTDHEYVAKAAYQA